ncbi:MAG: enamine deaminase RidA (YjgF/YER057c/UK114 family) [Paracoccaceae bacterium]|jgi:enamine deaminase RidA (YjgF/YER057c/UK114 family)
MTRRLISSGSPFEAEYAYSRAVAQGDWCFVAGTTGYDYAAMQMPEDPLDQARNCLATIARALDEAGFTMGQIVRLRTIVTDLADWEAAAPAMRAALGDIRPANTLIRAGLLMPEMKIEIEATAFRG